MRQRESVSTLWDDGFLVVTWDAKRQRLVIEIAGYPMRFVGDRFAAHRIGEAIYTASRLD